MISFIKDDPFLAVFLCGVIGLTIFFASTLYQIGKAWDEEDAHGKNLCAPAHYEQTKKVAQDLLEITCIDKTGTKKLIYEEK